MRLPKVKTKIEEKEEEKFIFVAKQLEDNRNFVSYLLLHSHPILHMTNGGSFYERSKIESGDFGKHIAPLRPYIK